MSDRDEILLEKEIQMMEKFDHPNIVEFEEAFILKRCCSSCFKSEICIVMEFCEGGDLAD